jgi:hypothetical protein
VWCSATSLSVLWFMPALQCILLALFTVEAAAGHPMGLEGAGLLLPATLVRQSATLPLRAQLDPTNQPRRESHHPLPSLPRFTQVGLLGGGVYVNAFVLINRDLPRQKREFALSSVAVADSSGILLGDVMGLWWQWCLFKAGGMGDQAGGKCPF